MKKFFLILILALSNTSLLAQESISVGSEKIKLTKVMTGLSGPWAFTFLNQDEILMTIKKGKLFRVNLKSKRKTEISGLPKVKVKGQGGLLDVQLAPSFKTSNIIFISYSKKVKIGVTTVLIRAKLSNNKLSEIKELFVAKTNSNKGQHFGSRIAFDKKFIYLSIGDRGYRDRAQMLDYHNGKIIRLNMDGSIPKDNPFINNSKALPEIYSLGHRNPQGLFYDKATKQLWNGEHGPRGGDEVNIVKPGKNYGWPTITYGKEYWGPSIGEGTKKKGIEQPKYYFVPSIAPCDLMIYSGKLFKSLKGNIFQGALKLKHINMLSLNNSSKYNEIRFAQDIGRVRTIRENSKGEIYFATDSGQLYSLTL